MSLRNEPCYVDEWQGRIIGITFECAQDTAKFSHLIECQLPEVNASRFATVNSF